MKLKSGLPAHVGFVPVLILLALAILGLVAYFGYSYLKPKQTVTVPTPTVSDNAMDPVVNWETYINPSKTFSFKYPSKFKLVNFESWMYDAIKLVYIDVFTNDDNLSSDLSKKTKIDTSNLANNSKTFFTVVEITNSNMSAEEYIKDIYKTENENKVLSVSLSLVKEMTIANKKAFFFEKTNSTTLKDIYLDLSGNTVLRITLENNDIYFDKILSTFKFID